MIENLMIEEHKIILRAGKGSLDIHGVKPEYYWHVFYEQKKIGRVFIHFADKPPFGLHPFIQMFLNKKGRSNHLGRHVLRKACEGCAYSKIYAYTDESNALFLSSAQDAGFFIVQNDFSKQIILVWERRRERRFYKKLKSFLVNQAFFCNYTYPLQLPLK